MTKDEFRVALRDLWHAAHDIDEVTGIVANFTAWSGATKDLLLGLGMVADGDGYTFEDWVCGDCGSSGVGYHACEAHLTFSDDRSS